MYALKKEVTNFFSQKGVSFLTFITLYGHVQKKYVSLVLIQITTYFKLIEIGGDTSVGFLISLCPSATSGVQLSTE